MTERMSAGELRMVRDFLGLDHTILAARLDVREDTVRRWETGREPIPYRVADEVAVLEGRTGQAVADLVDALNDARDPAVLVYRDTRDMPADRPDIAALGARWWRHVVARACLEVPGVEVAYEDEA